MSFYPRFSGRTANRPHLQLGRFLQHHRLRAAVDLDDALAFGEFGWTTDVQWWRLLARGVLVGVGTRTGKGCTSGHDICGVGSVSGTSLVNVATFLLVAVVTAQLLQSVGVSP